MAVLEKGEEKLTRGKVLKRAGIGAAAVWTVPMFVTSTASAATEIGGKQCAQLAVERGVGACTPCPGCNNPCRGACEIGECYCAVTVKGCCSCTVNDFCSNLPPCRRNRDCPAGTECTHTCCADSPNCTRKCTPGAIEFLPGSGATSGAG